MLWYSWHCDKNLKLLLAIWDFHYKKNFLPHDKNDYVLVGQENQYVVQKMEFIKLLFKIAINFQFCITVLNDGMYMQKSFLENVLF